MSEQSRLAFIEKRDGKAAAKSWARSTMNIYRTCVLQNGRNGRKLHFASAPFYREKFIRSYLEFKRYAA